MRAPGEINSLEWELAIIKTHCLWSQIMHSTASATFDDMAVS